MGKYFCWRSWFMLQGAGARHRHLFGKERGEKCTRESISVFDGGQFFGSARVGACRHRFRLAADVVSRNFSGSGFIDRRGAGEWIHPSLLPLCISVRASTPPTRAHHHCRRRHDAVFRPPRQPPSNYTSSHPATNSAQFLAPAFPDCVNLARRLKISFMKRAREREKYETPHTHCKGAADKSRSHRRPPFLVQRREWWITSVFFKCW